MSAARSDAAPVTRVRCALGMLGTDAHTKGIRTLARIFRDAGIEVIYLGEHNTYQRFAAAVAAEDADLAGVSFSTAGYLHHVAELMRALAEVGAGDVPVMVGGLIHADDEPRLRELGVAGIFGPGSSTEAILGFVRAHADGAIPADPAADPTPAASDLAPMPESGTTTGRNRVH